MFQKMWLGTRSPSTERIAPNCQSAGFQTGTGLEKIGSTVPNATATTAYVGTRKKMTSHAAPGSANDGQNQRLVIRSGSAGLEGRPRVLPERLPVRRQRVDRHALVEVRLADDGRGEVGGDVPLRDERSRVDHAQRRDVAVPGEVLDANLVVEQEVEERVGEH